MKTFESTIQVHAPVREVYNQWTQFEDFPRFMYGIQRVEQTDDTHLQWEAQIAGKTEIWDAEIIEQTPDKIIQWKSTEGAQNSGAVTFRSVAGNTTEVTLKIDYEPDGFVEQAGSAIGIFQARVEGDLHNFRDLMENIDANDHVQGWRKSVHDGSVQGSSPEVSNGQYVRDSFGAASAEPGIANEPVSQDHVGNIVRETPRFDEEI